jgi:penicillin-binding protein 2
MSNTAMMPDDRRSLSLRLSILQYLIAGAFAALAVGFWVFQIAKYEEFSDRAANNHLRKLPLRAPRGVLFDRNGEVLVANQNTFNIALVREHVKDLDQTLRIVAEATGVDEAELREKVERRRRDPIYRPIVLIENATFAQRVAVQARKLELPGIIPEEVPTRRYPDDALAAHLFGYVTEVREEQLARPEYKGVEPGAIVGQAGVEQAYNALLMGHEGNREVVVNSVGREIQSLGEQPPVEGHRLQLTIDADLQRAAEDGFRHFGEVQSGGPYNGAAVVLDPRNGEVLTFVSRPAFDPNKFAVGIDRASWSSYLTDTLRPLQNRALQATYSPGSTFKIVVATAALEEGLVTPDFTVHCSGSKFFYTRSFACHLKGGHGTLDMRHAIEKSCNVYFYTLGQMLGVDRIHKWATLLGLGEKSGIELPNEVSGLVPSSEWKMRTLNEKWYPGETISVAIGQGQVNVTPLSLAVMMATVANGGTRQTPHLVKAVDNGKGWEPVPPPAPKSEARMKDSTVQALHDGLWMVVNAAGTGGRARLEGRDISGKTGTAQVISLTGAQKARGKMDVRDHGWFVFFAPRDNPELAGVIFTEHSEHGYYGGPIIKHIVDTYYAKKEGRPLPTLVKPAAPGTTVVASNAGQPPAPGQTRQ